MSYTLSFHIFYIYHIIFTSISQYTCFTLHRVTFPVFTFHFIHKHNFLYDSHNIYMTYTTLHRTTLHCTAPHHLVSQCIAHCTTLGTTFSHLHAAPCTSYCTCHHTPSTIVVPTCSEHTILGCP